MIRSNNLFKILFICIGSVIERSKKYGANLPKTFKDIVNILDQNLQTDKLLNSFNVFAIQI